MSVGRKIKDSFIFLFGFVFIGLANAGAAFMFLQSEFHVPLLINIILLAIGFIVWGSLYYLNFTAEKKEKVEVENDTDYEDAKLNFFQKVWNGIIDVLRNLNPILVNSVGMSVASASLAIGLGLPVGVQILFLFAGFISGGIAAYYFTRKAMKESLAFPTRVKKQNENDVNKSNSGIKYTIASLLGIATGTAVVYLVPGSTMPAIISVLALNLVLFIAFTLNTRDKEDGFLKSLDKGLTNSSSYLAALTSLAIAFFNFFAGYHLIPLVCQLFGLNFACDPLNWALAIIGALVTAPAAFAFYKNFSTKTIEQDLADNLSKEIKHPMRFTLGVICSLLLATTLTAQIYGSIKDTMAKVFGNLQANMFLTVLITLFAFYLCFRTFMLGTQLLYPKDSSEGTKTAPYFWRATNIAVPKEKLIAKMNELRLENLVTIFETEIGKGNDKITSSILFNKEELEELSQKAKNNEDITSEVTAYIVANS